MLCRNIKRFLVVNYFCKMFRFRCFISFWICNCYSQIRPCLKLSPSETYSTSQAGFKHAQSFGGINLCCRYQEYTMALPINIFNDILQNQRCSESPYPRLFPRLNLNKSCFLTVHRFVSMGVIEGFLTYPRTSTKNT